MTKAASCEDSGKSGPGAASSKPEGFRTLRPRILYWLPLVSVLVCCGLLLTAWAFVVPVFESPDEPHHWRNAQYIHSHFALPPYTPEYLEAPQAPLYYILVSPFASSTTVPPILKYGPNERYLGFSFANWPGIRINAPCWPHYFVNCPQDLHRYWPIRRTRLATAAIAMLAVLFTALAALELTARMATAATAAALIGFLPQFDFRGATINNDPAVACCSAIAVYFMVRMLKRGFELVPAIWCSVALALAFLSKVSAVVLVPAFLLCIWIASPNWPARWRRSTLLLLSGAIVLPWLVRNELVLGDLFGRAKMTQMVPMMLDKHSLTSPYFHTEFLRLTSLSFFGYFGWMDLKMPGSIYRAYLLLFAVAACGLLIVALRHRKYALIAAVVAVIPILSLGFLVYANLSYRQPQGRLLFPALSAIMLLVALGLGAVPGWRKYIAVVVVLGCLSIDVYALTKVVYPAYWLDKPACWTCS